MISFLLVPLLSALAAAGAWFGLHSLMGIGMMQSSLAAAAVFCAFLVCANHFLLHRNLRRMNRTLHGLTGFETDLVSRLEVMERRQTTALDIENTERRLRGIERQISALESSGAAAGAGRIDAGANHSAENVVELTQARRRRPTGAGETENLTAYQLREGKLRIKLQPIVELPSRKTVALEAFAHVETENGEQAAWPAKETLPKDDAAAHDLRVISELAHVVRRITELDQRMPIHFRLAPETVTAESFRQIVRLLKADRNLASSLVLGIVPESLPPAGGQIDRDLGEMTGHGVGLCAEAARTAEDAGQAIKSGRFAFLRMAAGDLLHYAVREGERIGDTLAPLAAARGVTIIANSLSANHQAAGLIDIDVGLAQGDLISPPREISLGNAAAEGDGAGAGGGNGGWAG